MLSFVLTLFFACKKDAETSLKVSTYIKSGTVIVANPTNIYVFSGNVSDKIGGATSLAAIVQQAKYQSAGTAQFDQEISSGVYTVAVQNSASTTYGKNKVTVKVINIADKEKVVIGQVFEEYGTDNSFEAWNEYTK